MLNRLPFKLHLKKKKTLHLFLKRGNTQTFLTKLQLSLSEKIGVLCENAPQGSSPHSPKREELSRL